MYVEIKPTLIYTETKWALHPAELQLFRFHRFQYFSVHNCDSIPL